MNKKAKVFIPSIVGVFALVIATTGGSLGLTGQAEVEENTLQGSYLSRMDSKGDCNVSGDSAASGFSDIRKVTLAKEGENLIVTIETDADIPKAFSSAEEELHYLVALNADGHQYSFSVSVFDSGFQASSAGFGSNEWEYFPEEFQVDGSTLTIEISLNTAAELKPLSYKVVSTGAYMPEDSVKDNLIYVSDSLSGEVK